jgi:hypothetical protein
VKSARLTLLALVAVVIAGCGGSSGGSDSSSGSASPPASSADFPSPKGRSLLELRKGLGPGPVLAPTVSIVGTGKDRYGFGLFDRARKQIAQAPVALYVEKSGSRVVHGPFLARDLPLSVKPAFQSETVAKDPDAAKSLYVADLDVKKAGDYAVLGVAKLDGRLVATDPIYLGVGKPSQVPSVGERAPVIDTPTVKSAGGDIAAIDTRVPPDTMHDENFADVVGKKPVVLVFATPALCQSRVCGPVVDIAEEVKSEHKDDDVAFIHMEIYNQNNANKGYRPQLKAFHLQTEPWAFVFDKSGKISTRFEGAFSAAELETAIRTAVKQ